MFVLDSGNDRVEEFSPSGTYLSAFGKFGSGNGEVKKPFAMAVDSKGNVWVADTGNNRVEEFNESGGYITKFGSEGTGVIQFKEPKGIAIAPNGNIYVGDTENNRVEELKENGTFVATFGFGVSDGVAKYEVCTSACRAGIAGTGNGQMNQPQGVAVAANGTVSVVDYGNNRVEKFNGSTSEYAMKFGSSGSGEGQFSEPKGIAIDALGNMWVTDSANTRVQEFTWSGAFLAAFGAKGTSGGQFMEPRGITTSSSGTVYVTDVKDNVVEKWSLAPRPGNEGAHDMRTAYYTAEGESEIAACRNHPEWANLPCRTEPLVQPGINASPALPVTEMKSYNIWDELEESKQNFGSTVRTVIQTYDSSGGSLTSKETSTEGTSLPVVKNKYNSETGALEEQTTEGAESKTVKSELNTLGQLVSYTDADGNTSKYIYELEGHIQEVQDGKGKQTYAYEPSTGFLEKLVDSAAGTFTATYDVEGKMVTVGYPNKMTATYTYDQTGEATGITYVKQAHCASTCPETWFSDTVAPSIHGETLSQTSTLAKEVYAYDSDGRLLETQETPAGKGCKTRLYGYDEESNRTSLTTRESATETCATEGGTLQAYSYDSADRPIDAGVKYDAFGDTVELPEADAEGHTVTSTYYVDGQLATQTQNGVTNSYKYDPAGRTRETVSGGKIVISHYSGPGEALAWTGEGATWTRNVPGIDGTLTATQTSAGTVTLQLHDLQGNIAGSVGAGETETKLTTTYNSTDFGVPNEGKVPPKYAWLGAAGVGSETSFSSGIVNEGGASYVPQIARTLQTAPVVPPGAFPNGQGTGKQYVAELPGWIATVNAAEAARDMAEYIAKQEAEQQAALAAALAGAGEGEDPVRYLTAAEAESIGRKLVHLTTLGEAADFLVGVPDGLIKLVEGALTEHWDGVKKAMDWFKTAGEKLLQCANESFTCKFAFKEFGLKFSLVSFDFEKLEFVTVHYNWVFVNVFSPAVVEPCLGTVRKPRICYPQ
ncbi:MAG: hypothetical protein ACRDJ3_02050 [Solirubrobacteraceae bacterium]